MKNRNSKKKGIAPNQFIEGVTQQLVTSFNCHLDSADYVLAQLEAIALIMNKANIEKAPAAAVIRAFNYVFSSESSNGFISAEMETKIRNYLTLIETQN